MVGKPFVTENSWIYTAGNYLLAISDYLTDESSYLTGKEQAERDEIPSNFLRSSQDCEALASPNNDQHVVELPEEARRINLYSFFAPLRNLDLLWNHSERRDDE